MRSAVAFCATVLAAQTPIFDVASVRRNVEAPGQEGARRGIIATPVGLSVRQSNLRDCVQWAWGLREYQLTGPDWIRIERYDIATRTAAPATAEDLRAMMRSLLTDRFKLRLRREKREMPVNAMTVGRATLKLTASKHDDEGTSRLPGDGLRLAFRRTSIGKLGEFLSTLAAVDRPVEDRTGLDGLYDFRLDLHEVAGPWTSETEHQAAPSIATVIHEQLGLNLSTVASPKSRSS